MDYLSHNIAINLKRIRKAKAMSLDVVAEQTGVSWQRLKKAMPIHPLESLARL